MTKDDFLEKAQETIDKRQTKLEKLKEKVQDQTDESTDDIFVFSILSQRVILSEVLYLGEIYSH